MFKPWIVSGLAGCRWALAVWEGDPPDRTVWIQLDDRVVRTLIQPG